MSKRILFSVWVVLLVGVFRMAQASEDVHIPVPLATYEVAELAELTSHPEHYDGLRVYTEGWVRQIHLPSGNVPSDSERVLIVGMGQNVIKVIVPRSVPVLRSLSGRPILLWGIFREGDSEIPNEIIADWVMMDWKTMGQVR